MYTSLSLNVASKLGLTHCFFTEHIYTANILIYVAQMWLCPGRDVASL